ncbi:MAG: T9SS type A sorting domain-containing protein [Bacteroidota bacterium]
MRFLLGLLWCCALQIGFGQTIWEGPKIVFQKPDSANWALAQHQDRLSDSVWITRKNMEGFFNIRAENTFDRQGKTSPIGTEWANGSLADGLANLTFTTWLESHVGAPNEEVGINKVVHLVEEDIYLELKLLSWTQGGGGSGTGFGGGFSYERSTPLTSSLDLNPTIQIITSPDLLSLFHTQPIQTVKLFSINGRLLQEERLQPPTTVYHLSLATLPKGIYLLWIDDHQFVKLWRE